MADRLKAPVSDEELKQELRDTWRELQQQRIDLTTDTNRDAFGEITSKTKDLRPYNQAKERRLEMNRLSAFFKALDHQWPFCPVCGNRHFEWIKR
jgi:hypothetical protein